MRASFAAVLGLALTACVSEAIEGPRTTWELTSDQPAVEFEAEPPGRPPAREVVAAGSVAQDGDDEKDLIELFTAATEEDLGPDYLADQQPSPFHRLGHNIIRGLDGSWTKLYSVRAGRAADVVALMQAYVPDFPTAEHVPNNPDLPPDRLIRYVVQPGFYKDDVGEKFGARNANKNADIADVIHLTAPPDTLLFVDELLTKVLGDLPQIEIEILVVEVNLSDELDWDSKVKLAQLTNRSLPFDPLTNPPKGNFGAGLPITEDGVADGSGAAFSSLPAGNASLPGFLLSLQGVHRDYTINGVVSLLQTIGAAELLSSPKITVLNGHRARLTTGDKLPIFETTGNINNPTVKTIFEPTGVTIELVPFILGEDLMRIDLSIEVSSQTGSVPVVLNGVEVSSPIISQRSAGTTLHVYTDQTFALGGLKSTSRVENLTKVPLLGDIPLLGWLFKSRESATRKTEILFFVKPTIRVPSQTLLDPLRSETSLIDPGYSSLR